MSVEPGFVIEGTAEFDATGAMARRAGAAGAAASACDAVQIGQAATRPARAGCFAALLSCVPGTPGAASSEALHIPVIGCGAGLGCDGQVSIPHDVIGPGADDPRTVVRRSAEVGDSISRSVGAHAAHVRSGRFPSAVETFSTGVKARGDAHAVAKAEGVASVPEHAEVGW